MFLKAASIANGGEIFVLDMGEPVKIKDLAYKLIRMYGLEPDIDIKIVYTGLRAGEKEHEELFLNDKIVNEVSGISKIFIEKPVEYNEEQLFEIIAEMKKAAMNDDAELIIKLLNKAVPTYGYNYKMS